MSKLVAYFSASGVTARKAQKIAKELGADLHEIKPAVPYTSADLNWMDKKSRNVLEKDDPGSRPELAEKLFDASAYDEIYIGFPIWWYTAPRIINSFLESGNFMGKKVHLFATSGGSGIQKSLDDLRKAYPSIDFADGKMVNG